MHITKSMPVFDRLNIYILLTTDLACRPHPVNLALVHMRNKVRETAKQRRKGKQEEKRAVSPEKTHSSSPYLQQQVRA